MRNIHPLSRRPSEVPDSEEGGGGCFDATNALEPMVYEDLSILWTAEGFSEDELLRPCLYPYSYSDTVKPLFTETR